MSKLFEILIPCVNNNGKPIEIKQYKEWNRQARRITGGLTIIPFVKGQCVSPSGELFVERMTIVKIVATYTQMERVADMTAKFYEQEAILFYQLSNDVTIKHYPKNRAKEKTWQD